MGITQICPYVYVSNHYNLLNSKKHNYKIIFFNSLVFKLIKVLFRYGIISNFIIFKKIKFNKKLLYIKFTSFSYLNSPFFKKIKTVSTRSKKYYLSYKSIKLLQKSFKNTI